jgi:hypothetical protein
MGSHRPPGDGTDKRQPAAAVGQPATVVLIYGRRTKGVKGANGGWTRFERARAQRSPRARALTERRRYGPTSWRPFRAQVGHGVKSAQ